MASGRNQAKTAQAVGKLRAFARTFMNREWNQKIFDPLSTRTATETPFLLTLETLDHLGIGFVVCNHSGQVLVANRTAEARIRKKDGLQLNSRAELCGKRKGNRSGDPRLRATKIVPSREFGYGNAALSIQRTSGEKPLTVVVRSIPSLSQTAEDAAALLLIFDSNLPVRITEQELKQLYGMTTTESRLAILLTDGKSLDDCCRVLDISRATACTHLRKVFKKTGVRRQGELVVLLLKSIGLVRLGSTPAPLSPRLPAHFQNGEANCEPADAGCVAAS